MDSRNSPTIVEYYGANSDNGSSCGYCKSNNSSYSYGMWAHMMSVTDYQNLIDRGWRRSGCYCYKPIMEITCCPQYTIRCPALEFKISKSQKKVIKKFNSYVVAGEGKETSSKCPQNFTASKDTNTHTMEGNTLKEGNVCSSTAVVSLPLEESQSSATLCEPAADPLKEGNIGLLPLEETQNNAKLCEPSRVNSDPNDATSAKRECVQKNIPGLTVHRKNKSKILRKERKRIKLLKEGYTEEEVNSKLNSNTQREKTLEELLSESTSSDASRELKVHLVRCSPPSREFDETAKESYELYRRYQTVVHNSSPDDCSFHQYKHFLVNSPLKAWKPQNGPPEGYGSFHQQYWLDGKLIAIGVIDILPQCISSVYFFYDPDFAFLSLGTYGSLKEIAMVRSLHQQTSSITFYYLGYYIDCCPKMQYKANYKPSYLLCPEVYSWHPFEECKQKLEQQKYSRLNHDITATDDECNVNIDEVLVLFKSTVTLYSCYKRLKQCKTENEDNEVLQYAKLVGKSRTRSMLLYRADD